MIVRELSTVCPWCKHQNEVVTRVSSNGLGVPEPGDISLCYTCCGFSVYTLQGEKLGLRFPTPEEDFAMTHDPQLQRAQRELIAHKRRMGQ